MLAAESEASAARRARPPTQPGRGRRALRSPPPRVSFLAQQRAEREPADPERGERDRQQGSAGSGGGERGEEPPGGGEVVGRRVEDVSEHGDEHLGEEPAEERSEG